MATAKRGQPTTRGAAVEDFAVGEVDGGALATVEPEDVLVKEVTEMLIGFDGSIFASTGRFALVVVRSTAWKAGSELLSVRYSYYLSQLRSSSLAAS